MILFTYNDEKVINQYYFQMLKFGIMLYLVPNLTQNLAFVKFDIENKIILENSFFT